MTIVDDLSGPVERSLGRRGLDVAEHVLHWQVNDPTRPRVSPGD